MFDLDQTAQLKKQGFLAVASFSSLAEIDELRGIINPIVEDVLSGARTGGRDLAVGDTEDFRILEISNPLAIDPHLQQAGFVRQAIETTSAFFGRPATILYNHCIIKPPHSPMETAWHQDSAYASWYTYQHRRLHWWLPLQEATVENGCLKFVPTNIVRRKLRHRALGPGTHALTIAESTPEISVACPVPAGGCTVHLPRTLHAAGPNRSDQRRTAFILQIGVRDRFPRLS